MEVNRSRNGFTVIELVVAMALTMAILSGITMMYVNGLNEQFANQSQMSANSEAQNLAASIGRDIEQGDIVPTLGVTITTPTSAAGTYSTNGNTLVFQIPSWDNTNSVTVSGQYDTVIYQFVTMESTHKTYNIRRILSPGTGSSRTAGDQWMLPYDANRDVTVTSNYRSDPYANYTGSNTAIFTYYVQDTAHPGQVKLQTTETNDYICMVDVQYTLTKAYHASWLTVPEDIEARLRNWKPPGT